LKKTITRGSEEMDLDYPFLSVIIPIRNEERNIESCLTRILNQTYPSDRLEILVIDGMSTDGTRRLVGRIIEGAPVSIRLIDNPKGQRASALNIGVREARGEIILRVDARTIIGPDYIERCVATLLLTGADNVGGVQRPVTFAAASAADYTTAQHAIGIAMSHPFGVGNAQFRLGKRSGYVDTVYLGCFRREVFDRVGLFDEEAPVISEDSDMNQRIRAAGGKVFLDKDIIAYYIPRDKISDLWRLYFRYGGCRAGNLIKNRRLTAWRQYVPPLFLLGLILLPAAGFFFEPFFYLWLVMAGAYFCADLLVSLYLSSRYGGRVNGLSRPALFLHLFAAFPTMHFSWAMGFWRRLFQRPRPGEYWGY